MVVTAQGPRSYRETAEVGKHFNESRVLQVQWHPLSAHHLCVLNADGFWRLVFSLFFISLVNTIVLISVIFFFLSEVHFLFKMFVFLMTVRMTIL